MKRLKHIKGLLDYENKTHKYSSPSPEVSAEFSANLHAVNPVTIGVDKHRQALGIICLCAAGTHGFLFDVV